jgi:hypothetical protein
MAQSLHCQELYQSDWHDDCYIQDLYHTNDYALAGTMMGLLYRNMG